MKIFFSWLKWYYTIWKKYKYSVYQFFGYENGLGIRERARKSNLKNSIKGILYDFEKKHVKFYFYSNFWWKSVVCMISWATSRVKGTNGHQKTYGIFHVYCIFYSGFMCQTTVIFGITKVRSLVLNTLASWNCFTCRNLFQNGANDMSKC